VPDLGSRVIGPQAAAFKGAQPRIGGPAVKADPGDANLERMIEYVPAEIIAFSMVINAILEQAMKSGDGHGRRAGPGHRRRRIDRCLRVDAAWVTNAVISAIALPFWAYLMGAVAFTYHDGNLAAILAMSFTVVSGLVPPRPDKPKLGE
jgi:hypothetical protein